jgi:hypothetical protein
MKTPNELYKAFYDAQQAGEVLQVLWDRFCETLTLVPAGWTVMDLFKRATG